MHGAQLTSLIRSRVRGLSDRLCDFYDQVIPSPERMHRDDPFWQVDFRLDNEMMAKLAKRPLSGLEIDAAIRTHEKRWKDALMEAWGEQRAGATTS